MVGGQDTVLAYHRTQPVRNRGKGSSYPLRDPLWNVVSLMSFRVSIF